MELREQDLAALAPWFDTRDAGVGGEAPDGLTELDEDEESGAIHPAEDPDLTGLGGPEEEEEGPAGGDGRELRGGRKHNYRAPSSYVELMRSVGVNLSEDELLRRYYRERARPHLIRFPAREAARATDPLPEGVETWEPGSPLADVDWVETVARSPIVVPGVTTVQRVFGAGAGVSPERAPLDLYVGVDCSGSMANPKFVMSYPVLGAVILALSALRAGARVRAVLSGEPGRHSATDGWERREKEILQVLVGYLGTGYAFGVLRLKEDFLDAPPLRRPAHVIVVTDADIFHMLGEVKDGWETAERTLQRAGGGGTFVLHMPDERHFGEPVARLRSIGWDVRFVARWEDVVEFARAFSRTTWASEGNHR
ncbi:MAG: VWA domain-containing protein [Deltaproteobacteria bacterium]|nr:VWA domain-containing protein [Deltaproteobacteria bacterium]